MTKTTNRQKNGKRLLCCLLSAALLCGLLPLSSLLADPTDLNITDEDDQKAFSEGMKQLEEYSEKVEQIKKEQNEKTARQKGLNGQIKQKQNEVVSLQEEIRVLDGEIEVAEQAILALEEEITVKTGEVNERTDYLNQRLVQVYVEGDISFLYVLFDSASLTDFLTRFDLMGKIVDQDVELLTGLRREKAELDEDKQLLEETKTGLENDKASREEKVKILESQQMDLERKSTQLGNDLKELEAAEDELNELSQQIMRMVAEIQAKHSTIYMGSGTMGWPVASYTRVSSLYGYRLHPILKTQRFHSGIDIAAPKETPALAAETGKVIVASNMGGFGNTVILDHGGGVSSQYSHLNSMSVSVGEFVAKGQKVGGVGTTGLSTGNHLHFQIMVDGKTIDPLGSGDYYVREP